MATQVMEHKCPACGAGLRFDGPTGKLVCDYCDSTYDPAEIEAMYAQTQQAAEAAFQEEEAKEKKEKEKKPQGDWDTSGLTSDWGEEGAGVKVYTCPSCGAELICDATTAASSCPYCDNPTVVPGQLSGTLKPDFIIPFKLDKNAAVAALKKHYNKKKFLPKAFTDSNHIQEIRGVYVPFWLFDGKAEAKVTYNATRVHTHRRRDEEITVTDHYKVRREGSVSFSKVPVDGSSKMEDDLMDSIEPYNYNDLRPFSTAFLPGFLADKYDVDAKESAQRADQRCANSALDTMRESVSGYATCSVQSKSVKLQRGAVHYALMPVWLLNTKWKDKTFVFAMNGQTGKLVGDLPVDKGKYWSTFAIIAGIGVVVMAVVRLILGLL